MWDQKAKDHLQIYFTELLNILDLCLELMQKFYQASEDILYTSLRTTSKF